MLNLLPWRQIQLRNKLIKLTGLYLVTLLIVMSCVMVLQRVNYQRTLALVEKSKKKSFAINRCSQKLVVAKQQLQQMQQGQENKLLRAQSRFALYLIEQLVQQLPTNAVLTSLQFNSGRFQADGVVYGSNLAEMQGFKLRLGHVLKKSVTIDFVNGPLKCKTDLKISVMLADK